MISNRYAIHAAVHVLVLVGVLLSDARAQTPEMKVLETTQGGIPSVPSVVIGSMPSAQIGRCVINSGLDLNGDSIYDLFVGEPNSNNLRGRVVVINGSTGLEMGEILCPGPISTGVCTINSLFGFALAMVRFDSSGEMGLAVGAPGANLSAVGRVYIFDLFSGGAFNPTLIADIEAPIPPYTSFGHALAAGQFVSDGASQELLIGQPCWGASGLGG